MSVVGLQLVENKSQVFSASTCRGTASRRVLECRVHSYRHSPPRSRSALPGAQGEQADGTQRAKLRAQPCTGFRSGKFELEQNRGECMGEYCRIAPDVKLGSNVTIHAFVNLYG